MDKLDIDAEKRLSILHSIYTILRHITPNFSKNYNNISNVFNYVHEEEMKKEDLISSLIDTNLYEEIVVLEYELMISELEKYLEYVKFNKPHDGEKDKETLIYEKFAVLLNDYMHERVNSLVNPFVKVK